MLQNHRRISESIGLRGGRSSTNTRAIAVKNSSPTIFSVARKTALERLYEARDHIVAMDREAPSARHLSVVAQSTGGRPPRIEQSRCKRGLEPRGHTRSHADDAGALR